MSEKNKLKIIINKTTMTYNWKTKFGYGPKILKNNQFVYPK